MKRNWLWLLAAGLAACGQPLKIAPDVALKHHYDAAFRQQAELLHAEQVRVSATAASGAAPAVLTLEILNPHDQPANPDTLKQRVRKLAHLLVADLAHPAQYPVLNARVTAQPGVFARDHNAGSQAFIYPTAGLR